jgi:hypothetical protein
MINQELLDKEEIINKERRSFTLTQRQAEINKVNKTKIKKVEENKGER